MANRVKKDTPPRERIPSRQRYEILSEWLKFVRGEGCILPQVPLRFTQVTAVNEAPTAPATVPLEVRRWAGAYLYNLASAAGSGAVLRPEIALPATPAPRILVIAGRAITTEAFSVEREIVNSLDNFMASRPDVSRLRICPACNELFVAYNRTSLACPPPKRCGQQLRSQRWYLAHHSEAQKQALARYFEKRDVLREQAKPRQKHR
jgi:hypothetical protein